MRWANFSGGSPYIRKVQLTTIKFRSLTHTEEDLFMGVSHAPNQVGGAHPPKFLES